MANTRMMVFHGKRRRPSLCPLESAVAGQSKTLLQTQRVSGLCGYIVIVIDVATKNQACYSKRLELSIKSK